jgi:hypothetical protein
MLVLLKEEIYDMHCANRLSGMAFVPSSNDYIERLCGPVVRVPGTDPEVRVLFSALSDFLRSSGSGTGSTQPREYNRGTTWKKK